MVINSHESLINIEVFCTSSKSRLRKLEILFTCVWIVCWISLLTVINMFTFTNFSEKLGWCWNLKEIRHLQQLEQIKFEVKVRPLQCKLYYLASFQWFPLQLLDYVFHDHVHVHCSLWQQNKISKTLKNRYIYWIGLQGTCTYYCYLNPSSQVGV